MLREVSSNFILKTPPKFWRRKKTPEGVFFIYTAAGDFRIRRRPFQ